MTDIEKEVEKPLLDINGEESQDEISLLLKSKDLIIKENIDNNISGRYIFYVLIAVTECFAGICVLLVLILMADYSGGFSWDQATQFNYHPMFMVIGMVVLFGNSAIAYRVFRHQEKFTVKIIHTCLHCGALLFTFFGLIAVFAVNNRGNYQNLFSLHSWVGMTAVVLFSCQLFFGFICFLFPTIKSEYRRIYLTLHVFFGCVIFALAIVSCISGITEKMLFGYSTIYSQLPNVGLVANFLGASLVVFSVLVAYILFNPSFKVLFRNRAR